MAATGRTGTRMDVNEAVDAVGVGKWHIISFFILALGFGMTTMWQLFVITFLGANPDISHCKLPPGETNISLYIPNVINPLTGLPGPSACTMYKDIKLGAKGGVRKCTEWTHKSMDFKSTLVTDFDLVCEKETFVANSQTSFNAGTALGAALTSPISDRFGRKTLWFVGVVFTHVFGAFMAGMFDYWTFCICQFITGFFIQGMALSGLVLLNEMFPSKHRGLISALLYLGFPLGLTTLAGWAYGIREWRLLQLSISLPGFLMLLYWWFCPESPLWLHSRGRIEEAESYLRKTAAMSGKKGLFPNGPFLQPPATVTQEEKEKNKFSWGYLARYLKSPRCLRCLVVVCILFLGNNLVYFSMIYMSGFGVLHGDRYLNFFLNGILEVPGCLLCIVFLPRIGKRLPCFLFHTVTFLALGTLTVLSSPALDTIRKDPAQAEQVLKATTAMALLCKFSLVGAYITIVVYGLESFPTRLRNFGVGFVAFTGIAGATIAPYMGLYVVVKYPLWITGAVFTCLSLVGGLLVLLVPDPHGYPLPETVTEIEMWPLNLCRWLPTELDEDLVMAARRKELEELGQGGDGQVAKKANGPAPVPASYGRDYNNPAFTPDPHGFTSTVNVIGNS